MEKEKIKSLLYHNINYKESYYDPRANYGKIVNSNELVPNSVVVSENISQDEMLLVLATNESLTEKFNQTIGILNEILEPAMFVPNTLSPPIEDILVILYNEKLDPSNKLDAINNLVKLSSKRKTALLESLGRFHAEKENFLTSYITETRNKVSDPKNYVSIFIKLFEEDLITNKKLSDFFWNYYTELINKFLNKQIVSIVPDYTKCSLYMGVILETYVQDLVNPNVSNIIVMLDNSAFGIPLPNANIKSVAFPPEYVCKSKKLRELNNTIFNRQLGFYYIFEKIHGFNKDRDPYDLICALHDDSQNRYEHVKSIIGDCEISEYIEDRLTELDNLKKQYVHEVVSREPLVGAMYFVNWFLGSSDNPVIQKNMKSLLEYYDRLINVKERVGYVKIKPLNWFYANEQELRKSKSPIYNDSYNLHHCGQIKKVEISRKGIEGNPVVGVKIDNEYFFYRTDWVEEVPRFINDELVELSNEIIDLQNSLIERNKLRQHMSSMCPFQKTLNEFEFPNLYTKEPTEEEVQKINKLKEKFIEKIYENFQTEEDLITFSIHWFGEDMEPILPKITDYSFTRCEPKKPLTNNFKNKTMSKSKTEIMIEELKSQYIPQVVESNMRLTTGGEICIQSRKGNYTTIQEDGTRTMIFTESTYEFPIYQISRPVNKLKIGDIIKYGQIGVNNHYKILDKSKFILEAMSYDDGERIRIAIPTTTPPMLVPVIINITKEFGENMNPLILALLSEKEGEGSSLKDLLVMQLIGGAENNQPINPLMLALLKDKNMSPLEMMLMSKLMPQTITTAPVSKLVVEEESKPKIKLRQNKVEKLIDNLFAKFVKNNEGAEPTVAICMVKNIETKITNEAIISLGKSDFTVFYCCDSVDDLKALTRSGDENFIITDCIRFE